MKKFVAVLTASAVLLAGCSDSGSDTDQQAQATENYAPPAPGPVPVGKDWVDIKGQPVSEHSSGNGEGEAPALRR